MAITPLDLIDADRTVVHGQARIRGTRIPVSVILDYLAAGMTEEQIRAEYPSLPRGAVAAALSYAALLAREDLQGAGLRSASREMTTRHAPPFVFRPTGLARELAP